MSYSDRMVYNGWIVSYDSKAKTYPWIARKGYKSKPGVRSFRARTEKELCAKIDKDTWGT